MLERQLLIESARERLVHLDTVRGVAAFLVVIGHIRGFILVDYAEATTGGLLIEALYFMTGLGHSAVIAFFALSGFLVGGSALEALRSGTWSAPRFAVARMARLWSVVLPALALTWLLDRLGIWLNGGAGYDGRYWSLLSSGPSTLAPVDIGPLTLIGNAFFLQTICVPVLGSNGPLWSLANEFWYYVLFPALAWVMLGRGRLAPRAVTLLTFITACALLPWPLLALGIIWVAGALGHAVVAWGPAARVLKRPSICILLLGGVAVSLLARQTSVGGGIANDLLQGFAWAAALSALSLARLPRGVLGSLYKRCSIGLSDISFTLYATHFPVLALAYFTLIAPTQMTPGFTAIATMALLLAVTLVSAFAMWWLFERNTHYVRRSALRIITSPVSGMVNGK